MHRFAHKFSTFFSAVTPEPLTAVRGLLQSKYFKAQIFPYKYLKLYRVTSERLCRRGGGEPSCSHSNSAFGT